MEPHVERADLGAQAAHVVESLGGARHVGADLVERQGLLVPAEHEVAAHAGREVDHHVDVGGADAVDDLGVELGVA